MKRRGIPDGYMWSNLLGLRTAMTIPTSAAFPDPSLTDCWARGVSGDCNEPEVRISLGDMVVRLGCPPLCDAKWSSSPFGLVIGRPCIGDSGGLQQLPPLGCFGDRRTVGQREDQSASSFGYKRAHSIIHPSIEDRSHAYRIVTNPERVIELSGL